MTIRWNSSNITICVPLQPRLSVSKVQSNTRSAIYLFTSTAVGRTRWPTTSANSLWQQSRYYLQVPSYKNVSTPHSLYQECSGKYAITHSVLARGPGQHKCADSLGPRSRFQGRVVLTRGALVGDVVELGQERVVIGTALHAHVSKTPRTSWGCNGTHHAMPGKDIMWVRLRVSASATTSHPHRGS
eukprot:997796-Rhodomonas_salina.2